MSVRVSESLRSLGLVGALLAAALLVRLPGLQWGRDGAAPDTFHPDEDRLSQLAFAVYRGERLRDYYPAGYCVQVGLLARLCDTRVRMLDDLVPWARRLSLTYGVLTVALVFLLAREHGLSDGPALVAGAAYALAGLPIIYSRYGVTDSGLTFWFVLATWLSLRAVRKQCWKHIVGASLAAGMAVAFKLSAVAVLPVVSALLLIRRRWRWLALALLVPVVAGLAEAATLGSLTAGKLAKVYRMVMNDNVRVVPDHRYALNPLMLSGILVPALGLPPVLLACAGLRFQARRSARAWFEEHRFILLVVVLPAVIVFVLACMLAATFPRHILPVLPVISVAAGQGWQRIQTWWRSRWNPRLRGAIVVGLLLYQGLYVWSINEPYRRDTRVKMAAWMRGRFDPKATVYLDKYAGFYGGWGNLFTRVRSADRADFVLLHEGYYRRYLRSPVNPSRPYPHRTQVFHWRRDGQFVQDLLRGDLPFVEVVRFRALLLTPELLLFRHWFGTFPDFVGDCVLFRRVAGTEKPGDVIVSAVPRGKLVALTYDDGPNTVYTERLLEVLKAKGVTATFFLVGRNVAVQPDLTRRIQAEGHAIGNHSYSHVPMAEMAVCEIERELDSCDAVLAATLGQRPRLFRPPWGQVSGNMVRACRNKGYTIVLFSVVGGDWKGESARTIADRVVSGIRSGAIILLHDGAETEIGTDRQATVEATAMIIDALQAQGYRFTTVDGLL